MTQRLTEQVRQAVAAVRDLPGVTVRPGVSEGDLALLERRLGCHLPAAYRALLSETNGIEVAYGFKRWLGYGPGAPLDVAVWNQVDTWKWAYRDWYSQAFFDDFVVLAVQAHGNMTGCSKYDLLTPGNDAPFYGLAPVARPVPANAPLSHAILKGLVGTARQPRRSPLAAAMQDRFGAIPADGIVMHSPVKFPHFSDDEDDLDGAMVLPAVDAMVAKADVWREVDRLDPGDQVVGVEVWTDHAGRQRLRLEVHRTG